MKQSANLPREVKDNLVENGWPASGETSVAISQQLKYMNDLKSEIRQSLDKAMSGGKKKGKGGKNAAAAPETPKENCLVAIASTYPEMQL